jgi:hypothetical protein
MAVPDGAAVKRNADGAAVKRNTDGAAVKRNADGAAVKRNTGLDRRLRHAYLYLKKEIMIFFSMDR